MSCQNTFCPCRQGKLKHKPNPLHLLRASQNCSSCIGHCSHTQCKNSIYPSLPVRNKTLNKSETTSVAVQLTTRMDERQVKPQIRALQQQQSLDVQSSSTKNYTSDLAGMGSKHGGWHTVPVGYSYPYTTELQIRK